MFTPTPRQVVSRPHLQAHQPLGREPAHVWAEQMLQGEKFQRKRLLCFGFYTSDRILSARHPHHILSSRTDLKYNPIILKIHDVFPKQNQKNGFLFLSSYLDASMSWKAPRRKAHTEVLGVIPPMMGVIDKSHPQIPSDVHASLNRSQNPYIRGPHRECLVNLQ